MNEKILIATYHAEEWTRVAFMKCLLALRPMESAPAYTFFHQSREGIHHARQVACDYALDKGFDYLVQLDDDATFPENLVQRLLFHDKDLVCALAYGRRPPHPVCAYSLSPYDGIGGKPLEGIEHTGLKQVAVSGFHCSLMKTSVIKKLRDAGINPYWDRTGPFISEDFAMCGNLRKAGVQIFVDTDLISGHLGTSVNVDEDFKRRYKREHP